MTEKPKTPGIVIAAGVIVILMGCWSLLGGLCTGGGMLVIAATPEPPGPIQPGDPAAPVRFFIKEIPGYVAIQMAGLAISMLVGLGEIIAGIAAMKLKPMARILATLLLAFNLLLLLASTIYQVAVVMPKQQEFVRLHPVIPAGQPQPFDVGAMTEVFTYFMLGCVGFIQLAITLTIILMLNSTTARNAFAGKLSPKEEEELQERKLRYEGYDDDDDRPPPSSNSPERS